MERKWWQESIVYQIYPRSFMDSNGDGIGDLCGIISKLDYIKNLGADVIWLCPIYDSPNDDNGYDIRNYRKIMSEFGSMEDFDELIKEAHQKGLKIIMDLVVNHTSDEHKWFIESKKSKDNPYRDYYIWRNGKGKMRPNNWGSCFGGSAWSYDKKTDMYYLHLFSKKQPDLNWENPNVRKSVYDTMTWWLDKGVDGFRMDVISYISKTKDLPDGEISSGKKYGDFGPYVVNGPRVHEYLNEMNRNVISKYDVMTVGETPGVTVEEAKKYAGNKTDELNMVFQFEHMELDAGKYGKWSNNRFKLKDLKKVLSKWQYGLEGSAWNSLFWSNHDQPRVVSRFGDTSTTTYWEKSAKMLAVCLYMMKGTPYIYQGEELGMTNVPFESLEDYRDIETINIYDELVNIEGVSPKTVMEFIHHKSRDNARTPMQWDNSHNAGFSSAVPWIMVNPNYVKINAHDEMNNENSIYNFYKELIKLRKQYKIIIFGKYQIVDENNPDVFAYTRSLDNQKLLVVCNFSDTFAKFNLPNDLHIENNNLLISNYKINETDTTCVLRPYEARVYFN